MANVVSLTYPEYKKLEEILRTASTVDELLDVMDMVMQGSYDLEQCLVDFCNDNNITEEDLDD